MIDDGKKVSVDLKYLENAWNDAVMHTVPKRSIH
jgi:hypothetical protein